MIITCHSKFFLPLTIIFFIMSIILPYKGVLSFCVYNKMEDGSTMYVHQDSGQSFFGKGGATFHHSNIPTGKFQCCPVESRQCSSKSDKNHMVGLTISYTRVGGTSHGESYSVQCPAGGYAEAHRSSDKFEVKVFDMDGNHIQ
ncbi:hypothetical protein BDC45DRAFT_560699 [Circinella umbellata]|nr:hypothetical protein BDC45DRAFT_560699 [Circinella umbellata]